MSNPHSSNLKYEFHEKTKRASAVLALKGGKGGIRTLDSREAILVFETSPFNHSGTSPITLIISEILMVENACFHSA
jgi:hypothetical protein